MEYLPVGRISLLRIVGRDWCLQAVGALKLVEGSDIQIYCLVADIGCHARPEPPCVIVVRVHVGVY